MDNIIQGPKINTERLQKVLDQCLRDAELTHVDEVTMQTFVDKITSLSLAAVEAGAGSRMAELLWHKVARAAHGAGMFQKFFSE